MEFGQNVNNKFLADDTSKNVNENSPIFGFGPQSKMAAIIHDIIV